jgi:hypothetical protein
MSRRITRSTARTPLTQIASQLGPDIALLSAEEREWASATFEGARHRFTFAIAAQGSAGAKVAQRALTLAEYEFALAQEIVADCHTSFGQSLPPDESGIARRELVVELLTINAE